MDCCSRFSSTKLRIRSHIAFLLSVTMPCKIPYFIKDVGKGAVVSTLSFRYNSATQWKGGGMAVVTTEWAINQRQLWAYSKIKKVTIK